MDRVLSFAWAALEAQGLLSAFTSIATSPMLINICLTPRYTKLTLIDVTLKLLKINSVLNLGHAETTCSDRASNFQVAGADRQRRAHSYYVIITAFLINNLPSNRAAVILSQRSSFCLFRVGFWVRYELIVYRKCCCCCWNWNLSCYH
jgi:hypothetical protein